MYIYNILIFLVISVNSKRQNYEITLEDGKKIKVTNKIYENTIEDQDYSNDVHCGSQMDYSIGAVSTRGKSCRIHLDCGFAEVCSNKFKCERIPCKNNRQCAKKVNLPTVCAGGICSSQPLAAMCKSNAQCRRAGKEYVCESNSGQCKPQYGSCHETCDCINKYGMIKGEALCKQTGTYKERERVCLCRTPQKHQCHGIKTTTPDPPTPATRIVTDNMEGVTDKPNTSTTTTTTTTQKPRSNTCPTMSSKPPGPAGTPCFVHGGCLDIPIFKLICVKPRQSGRAGKCGQVRCGKDSDCRKTTSLPSYCMRGICKMGHCYEDKECPKGYGCADGHCKKIYGTCEYDCDCGKCLQKACINKKCYCKSLLDDCQDVA